MDKNLFVFLSALLFVYSCGKDDVLELSAKQKLLLGKWRQAEMYAPGSTVNELPPCEQENNTIFEFRADGMCHVSNPAECVGSRTNPYAISADGSLLVIEGLLYYIVELNNEVLDFSMNPDGGGYRQIWYRTR